MQLNTMEMPQSAAPKIHRSTAEYNRNTTKKQLNTMEMPLSAATKIHRSTAEYNRNTTKIQSC